MITETSGSITSNFSVTVSQRIGRLRIRNGFIACLLLLVITSCTSCTEAFVHKQTYSSKHNRDKITNGSSRQKKSGLYFPWSTVESTRRPGPEPRSSYITSPRRLPSLRMSEEQSENDGNDTDVLSHSEIARYSRHLVLQDVGMKGQTTLKGSSVLVIGAGGLGSPCLMYLAAAGVGHIGIVDADTVDESNLQRQIIHGTSTVNKSKCQSALERLQDINPHIKIRTYEEEFTSASAMRILTEGFSSTKKWDVVVDGSDNFPTKYLINDACELTGLPWVYSAILAFEGQISVFNYGEHGPTYRDMIPTPPPPGDVPSCAEGGVLGVLPGTMGCLQATEVIKILMGKVGVDGLLVGRVLVYDALKMKFSEVGLQRRSDDIREQIEELIDYQGFCAGPSSTSVVKERESSSGAGGRTMDEAEEVVSVASSFRSITPKEALDKFSKGWAPWVLDVRLKTENDIVALPFTDAVIPHRTVKPHQIPREGEVLVYCKAGVRGKKACMSLVEQGVDPDRLYNLDGGIMGWQKQVDSSMPRY